MAFEPVGIAARRLVGRLSVSQQERKRAAHNDNVAALPEVPRREEMARGNESGCGVAPGRKATAFDRLTRAVACCDQRRPDGGME